VLVASATIDGHAVALRLERADTFTIRRWVDVRPVMPWRQELTVVRTPNSRDTLLTAGREGLASRGYDATNRRRARRRNRDSEAAVSSHSHTKTGDNASRSRSTTFATRSRSASKQSRVAPLHQAVGYTDVSRRRREKQAKRLDAVVRRRISTCQVAPELG
jgi:prophage tail gpP-like protein